MAVISHSLFYMVHDEAGIPTGNGFRSNPKYGWILINLKENTYLLKNEKTDFPDLFADRNDFVEIRFQKRIFKAPIISSGFLDDAAVLKTALLLEASKKPFQSVRIEETRLSDLFLHLGRVRINKPTTVNLREVRAAIRWAESLRSGIAAVNPAIPLFKLDRICQMLYGQRSSGVQRQSKMASAYREVLCTDDSLLSIGLRAGYRSRSYFITAFKQKFVITPGALRSYYRDDLAIFGDKNRV